MHQIIIFSAILASAVAAPGYLLAEEHQLYDAMPAKSTYTQSSQVVDHGSTFVHTPAIHSIIHSTPIKTTITKSNQLVNHGGSAVFHPIHTYEATPIHEVYHIPSKSTVTTSKQIVNHGGTALVHAPVVHAPVLHTPVVYHSSPIVSFKTGDSAVTHQSSTVHETVPVLKSVPVVAFHH